MNHPVYRVTSFKIVGPYALHLTFNDQFSRRIDFSPILAGELYGPLKDTDLFEKVAIDPEIHTLVWPNGADFDPETLHEWPLYLPKLKSMARKWESAAA